MTLFVTPLRTMTAVACLAAGGALAQGADPAVNPFCQTAFSPGDSNADGLIQADEATAIASGAYASLDTNSDGSIDREELGACVDEARQLYLPETADTDAFSRFDADASGSIEGTEIATMVDAMWGDGSLADSEAAGRFVNLQRASDAYEQMTTEPRESADAATDAGATAAPAEAATADAGADAATDGAAATQPEATASAETAAPEAGAATEPEPANSEVASAEEMPEAVSGAEEAAPETDPAEMSEADAMQAITLEEFAARTGQVYLLLDLDRDTAISRDEFLTRAEDLAGAIDKELDATFGSLDADASGGISEAEYLGAAEARMGQATQRAEAAGKLDPDTGALPVTTYYILR